jgi:hypothetical protein
MPPDNLQIKDLRYQDITARVAGVDLKTTVRVLRALQIVARYNHDDTLAEELEYVLTRSAWQNDSPCDLDDKPSMGAVEACDTLFKRIIKRLSWDAVRPLQRLEGPCPYAEKRADHEGPDF